MSIDLSNTTPTTLVEKYVSLRDEIARIEEAHSAFVGAYKEAMGHIAVELERRMNDIGVKSLKTDGGTVSLSTVSTPSCNDWEAFETWVRDTNRLDVFPRKLNSTPFKSMVEDGLPLPPGVIMNISSRLSVRRVSGTKPAAGGTAT